MTRLRILALASIITLACDRSAPPGAAPPSPDSATTIAATDTASNARDSATATQTLNAIPRGLPYVTPSDTGPVLHLPPAMARALSTKFPKFGPWPWATYAEIARDAHARDTIASVRWVIGDFDGDGRLDVALHGNLDTTSHQRGELNIATMVVVMPRGDSALVDQMVSPERDPRRPPPGTRPDWLVLVPRKTYRSEIVNDAVGVSRVRRDGSVRLHTVYVWVENGFLQWEDH